MPTVRCRRSLVAELVIRYHSKTSSRVINTGKNTTRNHRVSQLATQPASVRSYVSSQPTTQRTGQSHPHWPRLEPAKSDQKGASVTARMVKAKRPNSLPLAHPTSQQLRGLGLLLGSTEAPRCASVPAYQRRNRRRGVAMHEQEP